MENQTVPDTRKLHLADLKEIAFAEGPCLTIAMPLQESENTVRRRPSRIKSSLQAAERLLAARGMDSRKIHEFLEPIAQIEPGFPGEDFGGIVVFRCPDVFRSYFVRQKLSKAVTMADHFQVLPLLRSLQDEYRRFYILGLSQKHVRLLRCTYHSSEEIPLGPATPTNVEQWLSTRTPTSSPDHGTERNGEGGSNGGSFTSTQDRDNLDPHLMNFFHRIDAGVTEVLRGESAPLVLTAVEHEASMYRGVNSYGHLAPRYVEGSPDSLKGGELHKRALEVVSEAFEEPMRKALQMYERLGGSERVSSEPASVVKAAYQGRVSHLFVAEGCSHSGCWDKTTMQVTSEGAPEDLLNVAALQTLAHGGDVWITNAQNVPEGGPVAALLRY